MSQDISILTYLKTGQRLSPLKALELFGCFRLSARIHNLRKDGYSIVTNRVTKGNKTWAEYSLEKGDQNEQSTI